MFATSTKLTNAPISKVEPIEPQIRVLSLDEIDHVSGDAGNHHLRIIIGHHVTGGPVPTGDRSGG